MWGESPEAVCLIKNPEYRRICKKEVEKRSSRPKASAIICVSKMLHERIIARIAPTHVPLVTPRISGVASGLENSA